MMRIIDQFSRFFVGGLFIFSGLIKLNDPVGTKIKLEEYFAVFSVDFAAFFEWFVPFAMPIGMFLIILEVVLGIALLINYKMKIATWILLLLIIFFTFLTFYSAYFNKVTDCGCFGDAIPLTPWESFTKDVILVVFIAHLFWYRHRFLPALRSRVSHIIILTVTVLSLFTGIYAIEHLPYLDFRPYKIGDNIAANMIPSESPITEYIFEKDGDEVRSQEWLTEEDGYKFVGSEIINEEESTPKIQDYMLLTPEGEDRTAWSFEGIKLMVIFQDTKTLRYGHLEALSSLVSDLESKMEVVMMTSIAEDEFKKILEDNNMAMDFYFVDGTVLKAMVRSNPGLLLVHDGTVKGKWHINDLPSLEDLASVL